MPRTIHCCWFGGPKTPLAERCLASWRRFAPGWEIREWNLDDLRRRFASPGFPPFVEAAIRRRAWAFVSDWARFRILAEEGGVYFDCDVELVATIDDLADSDWCATEIHPRAGVIAAPGSGIGLSRAHPVARRLAARYEAASAFVARPVSEWMEAEFPGLVAHSPDALGSVRLLPPDWFSPIDGSGALRRTDATRGIHHYAMSWAPVRLRFARWLCWHGLGTLASALVDLRRAVTGRGRA